jgi:two-component system sensor histidine kinase TctE
LARNIDLGFDGAPGAVTIEGDALLIREMLGNLLDNAIRYTPPKGQVTVSVAAERGKVLLSVEDSGPGIPPAERERVFERFHRILGTGTEGCGLGLAIVREIAQSHNADTRLGPRARGDGTLVTVVFPQAA